MQYKILQYNTKYSNTIQNTPIQYNKKYSNTIQYKILQYISHNNEIQH